jgi:hypothetical protein
VLSIGEYDERVFLGDDAPEEIGTPAKVPLRTFILQFIQFNLESFRHCFGYRTHSLSNLFNLILIVFVIVLDTHSFSNLFNLILIVFVIVLDTHSFSNLFNLILIVFVIVLDTHSFSNLFNLILIVFVIVLDTHSFSNLFN